MNIINSFSKGFSLGCENIVTIPDADSLRSAKKSGDVVMAKLLEEKALGIELQALFENLHFPHSMFHP